MSDVIALSPWDDAALTAFLAGLAAIAWRVGRGEHESSDNALMGRE